VRQLGVSDSYVSVLRALPKPAKPARGVESVEASR